MDHIGGCGGRRSWRGSCNDGQKIEQHNRSGARDLGGLAGGTVFIEEVAHWTLEEQAQFSNALERLARARSGSAALQRAPLRIVSASASWLIDLVDARQFGADLFYRLNMVHLVLPSGVVRAMA